MIKTILTIILLLTTAAHAHSPDHHAQDYLDGWIDGWIEGRSSNPVLHTRSLDERRLYWAVARTESHNTDALPGDKISIRYEPHWLRRCFKYKGWKMPRVKAKLYQKVPQSKWRTHRWKNNYRYLRLAKSYKNWKVSECAHWATSYGSFQIMGMHHSLLGFKSAREMSDQYHVNANDTYNFEKFIEFLTKYRGGQCHTQLKSFQFNDFAKCYNGDVRYARKLRANYQLSKEVIKS